MLWNTDGLCEKHQAMLTFGECCCVRASSATVVAEAYIALRVVPKTMPKTFVVPSIPVRTE